MNADPPSAWVARWTAHLAAGSSVLDVACGTGRHSQLLAKRGYKVTAVDRDSVAAQVLANEPNVEFVQADLEASDWPFGNRAFNAIVVTNYLHRPLFAALKRALAPGGLLVYETFAVGNAEFGRPSNPEYLLRPRELLDAFGTDLRVLGFEDGFTEQPRRAMLQRIALRNSKVRAVLPPDECHL